MIIRAVHDKDNPYFLARRDTAQDRRLSWQARGLLFFLFSKPTDWEVGITNLVSEGDLKREALQKVLRQLETCGYVHRYQERLADGKLGPWRTDVYESPQTDFPLAGQPRAVEPEAENQALQINRIDKVQRAQITEAAASAPVPQALAAASPLNGFHSPTNEFANWTEAHKSERTPAEVTAYCKATKKGRSNPQGLARTLWRSGEEDEMIWEWLEQFAKQQQKAHRTVETHQTCPICGAAEAFTINPQNPNEGYCNVEDVIHVQDATLSWIKEPRRWEQYLQESQAA